MNTHDKKSLSDVRSFVRRACNYEITVSDAVNRILAAIEPYQRRIAELESQLEAIGAGGVSARRITSTPSNASAKITERSQAYLDSNLDADEHAAFIKWAREAHDYPEYARLILDSEWCQGAVAGWQGAVEAARQRGGEPVGEIRPDDQSDDEVWAEIWADLPPGTKLYAEPVQKAQKECSKDAERSESAKVPSDEVEHLIDIYGYRCEHYGRESAEDARQNLLARYGSKS